MSLRRNLLQMLIRKQKSVSKKRPAVVTEAKVAKKKKTASGKTVPKDQDFVIVSVALDVMPIQSVDPISTMSAAQPSPPKRKAPKRKLKLTPESDEEIVEKEFVLEAVVVEQKEPTSVDDVDTIIEEVIAATEQMESDLVESDSAEDLARKTIVAEPVATKSDDIQNVVTEHSPAATDEVVEPLSKVQVSSVFPTPEDESMTIEEHLKLIPDGVMLPSLTSPEPTKIKFCDSNEIRDVEAADWYKKNLPSLAPTDKGKKALVEPDSIQGHPARDQFQLICGDIDFLVLLRENVISEAETDSIETALPRRLLIIAKYREVLLRKFVVAWRTNLVFGLPTTAIDQRTLDLLSGAHQEAVRILLKQ
ncbi:hypothetical protein F511_34940 [Dorcoceras hygrometricum]|uniref:Uncharacterized protein n=1 Tax=Dorcoceras hygrometricum TaxID=472368 RepID=A0A2Z7DDZ6_9LAMI|nr:hypothetical protein F511_34940 [Dorcoceras hygrometricum]